MELVYSTTLPTTQRYPRCAYVEDDDNIVLGSSDGSMQTFTRKWGADFVATCDPVSLHTGMVFNIQRIPMRHPILGETDGFVSGGNDNMIHYWIRDGTIISTLTGCNGPPEALVFSPDEDCLLYSGSWDGSVRAWHGEECIFQDDRNQHSTQVVFIDASTLLTASGTKALSKYRICKENIGSNTSPVLELIQQKPIAHTAIIRKVLLTELGIITCGNDGYIKVWNTQLEELLSIQGWVSYDDQSEFVYDVLYHEGKVYACGDDKHVRVFEIGVRAQGNTNIQETKAEEVQVQVEGQRGQRPHASSGKGCYVLKYPVGTKLQYSHSNVMCEFKLPQPARQLYMLPNTDLLTVGSSGAVVLTQKGSPREASAETQALFLESIMQIENKAKEQIDLSTLPTYTSVLVPGTKPGEVKVVNLEKKSMAVQWNADMYIWEVLGETMSKASVQDGSSGSGASTSKKTEYMGKLYDHVVDVELDVGKVLQLPFDKDDDPLEIASNFIEFHSLPKDSLMQIVNFIEPYIDRAAMERKRERLEAEKLTLSSHTLTNWPYIYAKNISSNLLDTIRKKIQENNDKQEMDKQLSTVELGTVLQFIQTLFLSSQPQPPSQPSSPSVTIDSHILGLLERLLTWNIEHMLPILDVIRLLFTHTYIIDTICVSHTSFFVQVCHLIFTIMQYTNTSLHPVHVGSADPSVLKRYTGLATVSCQILVNFFSNRSLSKMEYDRTLQASPIPDTILQLLISVFQQINTIDTTVYGRVAQEAIRVVYNITSYLNRNPMNLQYNNHIYREVAMTVLLLSTKHEGGVGSVNTAVTTPVLISMILQMLSYIIYFVPPLQNVIMQDAANNHEGFQERMMGLLDYGTQQVQDIVCTELCQDLTQMFQKRKV